MVDKHTTDNHICLDITCQPATTVLPRCLQILSRRGYMLTHLETLPAAQGDRQASDTVVMRCTLHGPERWHEALLPLLERIVDVRSVRRIAPGTARE